MCLEDFDDAVEGGFGLEVAVEEEGVVLAFPGEVVEPALSVVEVPEGDALDGVGVSGVELEELGVLLGLGFEDFGWAGVFVGVEVFEFVAVGAVVLIPFAAFDDVDIDLGDDDFEAVAFDFGNGVVEGFEGDVIELVVSLETDGIEGGILSLKVLDQFDEIGLFGGVFAAVVVVDEEGVGIGGACDAEGLGDEGGVLVDIEPF